jgi:hypothetical protein
MFDDIEISVFDVLAYLCEFQDIVDDFWSNHVIITCHDKGYMFMLKFMEVIMLNVMFELNCCGVVNLVKNGYNVGLYGQ